MSATEIAPIVKSIHVRRSAADAFRVFTSEIAAWWPLETHTRAKSAEGERSVGVAIEPHVGGRVFETLNDGRELDWGRVEVYEPGARFAMEWRMGRLEGQGTRVTVRFEALSAQTCRVTLTHDNWHALGEDAAKMRKNYNDGWVEVFERRYGDHAEAGRENKMAAAATRADWLKARRVLLEKEKALTRLRDELAEARRALPRVRVGRDYIFDSASGQRTLSDLFGGKSQLIVYHFMLGPDWENPCKSCSFWAEHFDGVRTHLAHRDADLAAVSRAPVAKIEELKTRFGWRFPWVSSLASEFNFDFGVSFSDEQDGQMLYNFNTQKASKGESPGLSVFAKDEAGAIFHTYSCYARGLDALNGTYQLLDLLPNGRGEAGLPWPMAWVKLKDQYAL